MSAGSGPSDARLARAWPALLAVYGLGLAALSGLTVDRLAIALGLSVASWLAFTALLLLLSAALAQCRWHPAGELVALSGGALGWYALAVVPRESAPPVAGLLATLAMLLAAGALGRLLSRLFGEPSLLPPALALAGLIDIWGVNLGVTARVAEVNPELVARASATVPGIASATGAFAVPDLSIGPGDLAVAALILTVAVRHGFDLRRNLAWMYGLTAVGLTLALVSDLLIPGLVFIGLAGIIANRERFSYTPAEKRALMVAAGLVALLLSGLTAWSLAHPPAG